MNEEYEGRYLEKKTDNTHEIFMCLNPLEL